MNVLFVANLQLAENEGIYKKIMAQASGLKRANNKGWLITKHNRGCIERNLQTNITKNNLTHILDATKSIIVSEDIGLIYIRHMIPSVKLIALLRWSTKMRIKVLYDIPTYPYYAEQFRNSNRKYRTLGRLTLDTIFWPCIYNYITKLVVIKSNSQIHMYKKMIEITNGADVDSVVEKKYAPMVPDKVSMVTVGTLYPYHGYDRVMKGLFEYNRKKNVIPVEFHIVGESPTIEIMKNQVQELGLKNVFFHGIKTTQELNVMYDEYDIGLGSVSLHRRNADIDTTIKVIEYYCRGVVVATSGKSPMDQYDTQMTIHVVDDDNPLDISLLIDEYRKISTEKKKEISKLGKEKFSWDYIMSQLCTHIDN